MLQRLVDAQTLGHDSLALRMGSMDVEQKIARLLRDFVPQLDIEFQSDHPPPLVGFRSDRSRPISGSVYGIACRVRCQILRRQAAAGFPVRELVIVCAASPYVLPCVSPSNTQVPEAAGVVRPKALSDAQHPRDPPLRASGRSRQEA